MAAWAAGREERIVSGRCLKRNVWSAFKLRSEIEVEVEVESEVEVEVGVEESEPV